MSHELLDLASVQSHVPEFILKLYSILEVPMSLNLEKLVLAYHLLGTLFKLSHHQGQPKAGEIGATELLPAQQTGVFRAPAQYVWFPEAQ